MLNVEAAIERLVMSTNKCSCSTSFLFVRFTHNSMCYSNKPLIGVEPTNRVCEYGPRSPTHRLRRQYSQKKDPAIKTRINQLQKQVKEELKVESLVSWEKVCNSISLETNSTESWRKIKNFLKAKGQRDYPTLHHANKVAKTNADKAQLFAESVERHFGIERDHFDSNHFDEVNKFIEYNHRYFYPPEDPDDYRFDVGNEHELMADVDAPTLFKLVKFLKGNLRSKKKLSSNERA